MTNIFSTVCNFRRKNGLHSRGQKKSKCSIDAISNTQRSLLKSAKLHSILQNLSHVPSRQEEAKTLKEFSQDLVGPIPVQMSLCYRLIESKIEVTGGSRLAKFGLGAKANKCGQRTRVCRENANGSNNLHK